MTSIEKLDAAAELIYRHLSPTPQISWPLLNQRTGCETWVKHENHCPTGAFKIRGGLVYMDDLRMSNKETKGVVLATRGNHGQSIALAASIVGIPATVVVPQGNSAEKNAAMQAFSAELIEHGSDFQESLDHARELATNHGKLMVESFHPLLVRGVASYGLELFRAVDDLDTVYVPIGLGSGICATIHARDALDRRTEIVGVVAHNAPSYALSFANRKPTPTDSANTFADGVACRTPVPDAVECINKGAARVITVSEDEIAAAIRHYYSDTHNVAEGAGAAGLAALQNERSKMSGKKVGVVLSGGNIDTGWYRQILAGGVPVPGQPESTQPS